MQRAEEKGRESRRERRERDYISIHTVPYLSSQQQPPTCLMVSVLGASVPSNAAASCCTYWGWQWASAEDYISLLLCSAVCS